ncbi:hypothetical protein [Streptomyces sp. LaBMicrA B280]|uniref:hypothetical protein n=1 Tax=Streptomyces sp. LaBMicrA B280 TaxID=3391001 RepID=UPI003BA514FC
MNIIALEAAQTPLPVRPTPHERDGRQAPPSGGRPHPQHRQNEDSLILEALRRVVEQQIGPRDVGALYTTGDGGVVEVVAVVRDPERARALLGRRCAQWALVVKDVLRPDSEPVAVGTAWAVSDYLVREANGVRAARKAVAA